jgi:anti-anti-sigma regulatory factor
LKIGSELAAQRSEHAITEVSGIIVVTLLADLDETQLGRLSDTVLERLVGRHVPAVVLDCSGVDILGHSELDSLGRLLAQATLMGSDGAICSLAPGIASYIVEQQIRLPRVHFFLTLEDALQHFQRI